jgi:hypothetical protein
MDYLQDLVRDPSLNSVSHWYAVKKWLKCPNAVDRRMWDEPWTSDDWWEYQVIFTSPAPLCSSPSYAALQDQLPLIDYQEHVYCGWHLWTDEGRVSRRVNMHPIVIRPAWIDFAIRNGSGHGGGLIVGFVPKVPACLNMSRLCLTTISSDL